MIEPCQVCARDLADGATFCTACAHLLDADLADVCALRGLAYDLDLAITRQAVLTARDGGRPSTTPIPFDDRASRAAHRLDDVLGYWARRVADETGDTHRSTVIAHARLLRKRVGWLRHHPAGAQAWEQITGAVRAARRVVDRPADRRYAGPCDCGEDLYGRINADYVTCRNPECRAVWDVDKRRIWLLRSCEDMLLTATEISRAIGTFTPSAVRGYAARGRLVACGELVEGGRVVPLYLLADALDLLAERKKASA